MTEENKILTNADFRDLILKRKHFKSIYEDNELIGLVNLPFWIYIKKQYNKNGYGSKIVKIFRN